MTGPDLSKSQRDILSLLGLARRAQILAIGQDQVRQNLRKGSAYLLIFPDDVRENVRRLFRGYEERGACKSYVLKGLNVIDIAAAGGLPPAQVLGLPREHGLARRLEVLFDEGVDAIE